MDKQLMRFALALLLLSPPAWGAACTLALGTDNPKSLSATAALWDCGHIPNTSDTVADITGAGTSALTLDQDWTVGTAPATNAEVFRFSVPVTWGAHTFTVRGKVAQNNATATFQAGAIFRFDPAGQAVQYTWQATATGQANSYIKILGTALSRVKYRGNTLPTGVTGADGQGYFAAASGNGAITGSGGPGTAGAYFDLENMGDATNGGWQLGVAGSGFTSNAAHFRVLASGGFYGLGGNLSATGSVIFDDGEFVGVLSAWDINITTFSYTSGTRRVARCILDKAWGSSSNLLHWDFIDNYFHAGISGAGTNPWNSFTRNFYRTTATTGQAPYGDISGTYLAIDSDAGNPHFWQFQSGVGAAVTSTVGEQVGKWATDYGDFCLSPASAPAVPRTYTCSNNIVNMGGATQSGVKRGSGNLVTMLTPTTPNVTMIAEHNTVYATNLSLVDLENTTTSPNTLTLRSNLIAGPAGQTFYKVYITGATTSTDVCVDAAHCDYNGGFNYTATCAACAWRTGSNQAIGYASIWTSPVPGTAAGNIGQHDVDGDPKWVDDPITGFGRNVANADRKLFGAALSGTKWASSLGTLAFGAVVWDQNANFYANDTINYRCIVPAGCDTSAANTEPGAGSAWRTQWEMATYEYFRASLRDATRTLYAGLYAHEYFRQWVFAGFAPRSKAYQMTYAGDTNAVTWIGAVNGVLGAPMFPLLWGW